VKVETGAGDLPVDPERLRREFGLGDDDIAAYIEVTRRILSERDPRERARVTREILARGRTAREKGGTTPADQLAAKYLAAVERMQRRG
jgi:hypothetical protein